MSESKTRHIHSLYEKKQIVEAKFFIAELYQIEPQNAYVRMQSYANRNQLRMCDLARRILRKERPTVEALSPDAK